MVQLEQSWFASQVPLGQSLLVLQPRTQTSPVPQYSPLGQLSVAPGMHAAQVWVVVSQRGSAELVQPVSSTQPTQVPLPRSHCWPDGQACVALQPGVQACSEQIEPGAQSVSTSQATQVLVAGLQTGVAPEQSALLSQPTQVCVEESQTGVAPAQSLLALQPTHAPASVLQTWPLAQAWLASQPAWHAWSLPQTWPAGQSPSTSHSTQVCVDESQTGVAAVHSWPEVQATQLPASTSQTWLPVQFWCWASQPAWQVWSAPQVWPVAQSESAMQATQVSFVERQCRPAAHEGQPA